MVESNGHPMEAANTGGATTRANDLPSKSDKPASLNKPTRRRRPNYAQIHSKPLPLDAHPLPAFHPTNPISLLRLAYTYVLQLLSPPSSHPAKKYIGLFSPETRSVHVTDPHHVRALWEMGFFGKGALSRSEPSWLEREKVRMMAKWAGGGGRTAEEATNARREERRLKKMERARAEAQKIERQRLIEEGKLDPADLEASEATTAPETAATELIASEPQVANTAHPPAPHTHAPIDNETPDPEEEPLDLDIPTQEHLQLTLEEAFFLHYALGVLDIYPSTSTPPLSPIPTATLLPTFSDHSFFPPRTPSALAPDDPFLVSYAAYHHFRSLGWVVRSGTKFSVDYLLYYRGPVFSHAEFAVLVVPSAHGDAERGRDAGPGDWWWVHCVNRVQSQVLKSLVLVYVDVPAGPVPVREDGGGVDVGRLLRGYRVREFIVKRWVANRSRD